MSDTAIVIGGGHAGGELALSLRQNGWDGKIILISQESSLPYHRPPLSKGYLLGAVSRESLELKPASEYQKANITVMLGERVQSLDRFAKKVFLSNGGSLEYDKLGLTLGARPRQLRVEGVEDGGSPSNLHYLRTAEDADRLAGCLQPGRRLVIVGGGYVGLEVAASARRHGLSVTLLEAGPRVLGRVAAPVISEFYEQLHRDEGVDLRTNVSIRKLELDALGKLVTGILCDDGDIVDVDVLVVGIGVSPEVDLAREAGLDVTDGIVVNEYAQTSDPHIYAAGDCANHPNAFYGKRLRLESVPNATEQARTAALSMCGKPRPYLSLPWFWSDQYGFKLQTLGLSNGYDQVVLRGSREQRSFATFYLAEGRMIAADLVGRPLEFVTAKRMVSERMAIEPAKLADETVVLKALLESS